MPYDIAIKTNDGMIHSQVKGWVAGVFGIHAVTSADPGFTYVVDHLPTGCRLATFHAPDSARQFVARIAGLADWPTIKRGTPKLDEQLRKIATEIEP